MILVRDVFRLRFGAAREAVALWQEGIEFVRAGRHVRDARLLTDLVGPFYTLVLETTYDDLESSACEMREVMGDAAWRGWYQRFVPLVESGHREMFTVVGSTVPPLSTASLARAAARA
ncbi:hypothetical protein [Roseisolibacter sp. H3M3-2]|uniref:hypothetical protein n=1 Tax=Roseisolibacter sp. H3M3-2 TaxID=3031323 RepID=UPI0023DB0093|nr:hypothetical protein [Roseisolibacter sp. H3M3-2]MDF1503390.1 hypothetical protein [Roseisolibacter sp. H3M3-2]